MSIGGLPLCAVLSAGAYDRSCRYASGEHPERGDIIVHADETIRHPEVGESWIVISIAGDMVRAKCERAPVWRQAFYTKHMNLAERRGAVAHTSRKK